MDNVSIITPHAAFLVWNYSDRMGGDKIKRNSQDVDQLVISTLSLKSMSTNKSKSTPSGTFEVRLAPTKNWVQVLTPGSWCTLLMSREPLTRKDVDAESSYAKANPKAVKFFGRVDSVRCNTVVDPKKGARITEYIVTGVDWGSMFNSALLVDPAMAQDAKNNDTALGYVSQLIYNEVNTGQAIKGVLSASTYRNIQVLLSLWGRTDIEIEGFDFKVKPAIRFSIPKEVVRFFGFESSSDNREGNVSVADLLNIYHGSLKRINNSNEYSDSYDEFLDSYGVIQGPEILGENNVWGALLAITNQTLNELICDLRWEGDKPKLALYKRIRPFLVNKDRLLAHDIKVGDDKGASVDELEKYISEFKNLRRIYIPLNEVISFNGGTNWADRINFIEVKINDPQFAENVGALIRLHAQFYDEDSITREGLKSFIARNRFMPGTVVQSIADTIKDKKEKKEAEETSTGYITQPKNINRDNNGKKNAPPKDVTRITQWKYLLKEWYFDTHRMLNGSISFFGQDKYIQVGDNIIVDAKVTGFAQNTNLDQINNRDNAYLLMHVENVSHSFTVNEAGARHFTTTVSFVRGIIVGRDGASLFNTNSHGLIDQDVTSINTDEEINQQNTATKTYMDPD